MTTVLNVIESELTAKIRQAPRHRRRRLISAAAVAAVLASGTTVGLALRAPSAVDRLLSGSFPFSAAREHADRIDLLVYAGPAKIDVTTYRTRENAIATTVSLRGSADPLPPVGWANAFVIADNLLNGPLAGFGLQAIRVDHRTYWALGGTVDAKVRAVSVLDRTREYEAQVSEKVISAPVQIPTDGLTAAGRRRAARMPGQVMLRSYAATLPLAPFHGRLTARLTLRMTMADGAVRVQKTGRLCASRRCGMRPTVLARAVRRRLAGP